MSAENRNFRHGYYDKVGFHAIDEKKSFDILLREKPPDLLVRLAQLISRVQLSSVIRRQLWMLLLDVTYPDERLSQARREIQRQTICDIVTALEVMSLIPSNVASSKGDDNDITEVDCTFDGHPKLLVLIYLVQTKRLGIDANKQMKQPEMIDLLNISTVFTKEFLFPDVPFSLEDTYPIFMNFLMLVQANFSSLIEVYQKFIQYLAIEDSLLHQHLVNNGIIKSFNYKPSYTSSSNSNGTASPILMTSHNSSSSLTTSHYSYSHHSGHILKSKLIVYRPIVTWFVRFYCGIIHQNFVLRVLDKVIGSIIHGTRPFYVLLSVSKALINHWRDQLLNLKGEEELTKRLLLPLSFEESERIVVNALRT